MTFKAPAFLTKPLLYTTAIGILTGCSIRRTPEEKAQFAALQKQEYECLATKFVANHTIQFQRMGKKHDSKTLVETVDCLKSVDTTRYPRVHMLHGKDTTYLKFIVNVDDNCLYAKTTTTLNHEPHYSKVNSFKQLQSEDASLLFMQGWLFATDEKAGKVSPVYTPQKKKL